MESIKTATRIHPLMAAAAASVVIVSLAGTAAITGLLPTSRGAPAPALSAIPPAPLTMMAAPQQYAAEPIQAPQQYAAEPIRPAPAPAVKHSAPRHPVVHHTQVARNDYQQNYNAPVAQQPAKPNYVGIGVGAVVGGLLGNQVGGGNGKKLATVAGVIGGGMLGNQIANGNR
ncbi:MAG: glycine zipper 2TM domain-containing protein [Pseudomonadota bacterium]|nr:glycine zipper 2TM domain-containing protein [Pseudomonadota bacterium]